MVIFNSFDWSKTTGKTHTKRLVIFTEENWEELPLAPPPEPAKLTEEELEKLYAKEEHTLRELRIFLREVCAKLARNRMWVYPAEAFVTAC